MFLRKLFLVCASTLAYLSSVETPRVEGVGFIVSEYVAPIHPTGIYNGDIAKNSSKTTVYSPAYNSSPTIHPARPISLLDLFPHLGIDIDIPALDKVGLTFVVTLNFASQVRARTGFAWWRSLKDLALALGGLAFTFGMGLGDNSKVSIDDVAVLAHDGMAACRRRAGAITYSVRCSFLLIDYRSHPHSDASTRPLLL
jgi:hypothetical protein